MLSASPASQIIDMNKLMHWKHHIDMRDSFILVLIFWRDLLAAVLGEPLSLPFLQAFAEAKILARVVFGFEDVMSKVVRYLRIPRFASLWCPQNLCIVFFVYTRSFSFGHWHISVYLFRIEVLQESSDDKAHWSKLVVGGIFCTAFPKIPRFSKTVLMQFWFRFFKFTHLSSLYSTKGLFAVSPMSPVL